MDRTVIEKAPAKVNLFLDLGRTLPNGYHSIFTMMRTVSLADTLTVGAKSADKACVELTCSDATVPTDGKNTAFRAAELWLEKAALTWAISIELKKLIPHGAGLGGGSADAAAVLRALNRLAEDEPGADPVPEDELLKLALRVGADVPFCVRGGFALCQNVGEILSRLPTPAFDEYVIVMPDAFVPTSGAYALIDAAPWLRHPDRDLALSFAASGDTASLCSMTANVFEQVVDVTGRVEIKSIMRACGARLSMMSGSGASVFGLFDSAEKADSCVTALHEAGFGKVFRARGC